MFDSFDTLDDASYDIVVKLADGIIHKVQPEIIKPYLHPDFPIDKLEEYLAGYECPSKIPGFREEVKSAIDYQPTWTVRQLSLLTKVLQSRLLSPTVTRSTTLVTDMSYDQLEQLLRDWRDSPIPNKRQLFRAIHTLTMASFVKLMSDLHGLAIGYPNKELREQLYNQEVDYFKYQFVDSPKDSDLVINIPEDVLVVGSGAGAGVVVATLAESGFSTLVLEKGKYFANDELVMDDHTGTKSLYEGGGGFTTSNTSLLILAGSNFGGGTTVNWSACIPAPFKVRKEWYDKFGLEWVADGRWDANLKYVWEKMGASDQNIVHSRSNQTVLDGAKQLGYAHGVVNQNSGNREHHNCGMCHVGCRFGVKQGSVNCWFRQPAEQGLAKFMTQVKVLRIIYNGDKVDSVLCRDESNGVNFKIKGFKKLVVSAGSLQTPVLLQKSGFSNKNIGKHLKLHPVTVAFGDWGKDVDTAPFNKSIMTSVVTEVDDYDGQAHGTKIETMLHAPFVESVFFPWNGSDDARQNMMKYKNLSFLLLITRDKGEGSVTYDSKKPDVLVVDYDVSAFDREALLEGFLTSADILYVEGAKEIFSAQTWTPRFKSDKPKHARNINDADYQKWRSEAKAIPFDAFDNVYGSAHQMSSCRSSGKGSGSGAVDTKGRLFECKDVIVADASVMPTASGANPMITTMMFARHIATNLVEDLKPSAKF